MTVESTLTLPVIQMSHMEKQVELAQNQPHIQQLVAQQTIAEELKKQDAQVSKTDKTEKDRRIVDSDEAGQPRQNLQGQTDTGQSPHEDASDEETQSPCPWVGNIINVKI